MKIIKLDNRANFTNIIYKQQFAEKENDYKKLLNDIIYAFNTVEYLNVIEGVRDAYLTFIKPSDLQSKIEKFKKYGLSVVLLNKEADMSGSYGNHSTPYDGGEKFVWRSIITKPQFVDDWKYIWNLREKDVLKSEYMIGRALGYPDCCSKQFTEIWMSRGGIDTTWQQAACTAAKINDYSKIEQLGEEYNAIEIPSGVSSLASNLLRWAGPRLVSHLPCSFNCIESKAIAIENLIVAAKHGFSNEYYKLSQMLEWETTWTAEFGVATIETPVFTIVTATDVTETPYKVIKRGHNNCVL